MLNQILCQIIADARSVNQQGPSEIFGPSKWAHPVNSLTTTIL